MVGSKMSLSMVGWEGLLRSSIRIRGSPSLKATVELWFARRMGEKQYMEEKVGRIKGEKKSCLLQCLPKASPGITSVTFTQS